MLLAVDGFPVARLPVAALAARLTGAGGSEVSLTLLRPAPATEGPGQPAGAGAAEFQVRLVRGDPVPPPRSEL